MMQVHLPFAPEVLDGARDRLASEEKFWVAGMFFPSGAQGSSFFELSVGDCTMGLSEETIVAKLGRLVSLARQA
jgi:hypothetical protein